MSAGTHPFSHWQSQLITTNDRYKILEEDLQDVVRSILIFGLHVHVGVPDNDLRIEIMNEARYFLPHMLALSTSSPFWLGRFTGLKSYRTVVWQQFPRTGIPSTFDSWSEYEKFVDTLVETNCMDNAQEDLVGPAPAPLLSHPRVPRLRYAGHGGRDASAWPRCSRPSSSSSTGCASRTWASASTTGR